jgi:hypothetical protein
MKDLQEIKEFFSKPLDKAIKEEEKFVSLNSTYL